MKKSILFSFLLVLGAAFHVTAQTTYSGTVKDHEGNPLPGAVVVEYAGFLNTITDANGNFEFTKLSPGKYVFNVRYVGFVTAVDTVVLDQSPVTRDYNLEVGAAVREEFVVEGTRAGIRTPMTYQNLDKEAIEKNNLGQDLPILLNQTVSTVTTSDAGAGIGYTGLRIRGSDATRINVTINGVPLNDPESHGVFWVNMPDFSSTLQSVQIQRGVGTSSNGSGAFGATLNLQTNQLDSNAYAEFNNSVGSFNTRRHNMIVNTGLINDHWAFQGRLSYISSDGYIDRSAANLQSYFVSGGYYGEKILIKGLTFGGKEVTQQAWYGTPESRVDGDDQAMLEHALNNGYSEEQTENLLNSGRTYNHYLYDNEIDHYQQDHYMLMSTIQISRRTSLNVTGHYTYGRGYFEQFRDGDDFSDYNLDPLVFGTDTITSGDFIRRRWLRNHFYGGVYTLNVNLQSVQITAGGALNQYDGEHFGELIWAQFAGASDIRENYYNGDSRKLDGSQYLKVDWQIGSVNVFADVQARYIDYTTAGTDNDLRQLAVDEQFLFFNPKLGASMRINAKNEAYVSISRGSREPVRNDFIDAVAGTTPKPEFLTDLELGYRRRGTRAAFGVNGYLMYYEDQLVLTGELNDVGSAVRANVDESYRLGLEAYADINITKGLYARPNISLSQNKITSFTELIYDYTNGFDIIEVEHSNTDIAFSPNLIAGNELGYRTDFGFSAALLTKYVGEQFLDNTSNSDRAMDAYLVNDVRLAYQLKGRYWKHLELTLLINNVADVDYSANGYTFTFVAGEQITENFYYPQAGRNFLVGLKTRF